MNARCSTSETICLQCGDVGFTNAFVYCVKCLGFAVHRYCLDVIPESLDEYVRWVCDHCEPAFRDNKAIQCRTRDRTASKQLEGKRCEQSSSQWLEEQKVDDNLVYDDNLSADAPPRESKKTKRSAIMVSIVRNDQHKLSNNSSKRPHEKRASIVINECAKLDSDSTEVKESKASEKRDHRNFSQKLCESDPEPGTVLHRVLSCNSTLGSSKKKKTNVSSEPNLEEQRHRTLLAQHLKEHERPDLKTRCSEGRGINVRNDHNKSRESEVSEDRTSVSHHKGNFHEGFSKDSAISSMVDCNMHATPLKKPIWRGSFNIRNKNNDLLDGLMAHMSSRASQKVYDEACQFQPVVHLEMLPKSDVWPKSFVTSEPSGENIALYFFPSDMRNERVFDHFVDEMVHKELALRAVVQNAELLVFTSMELPLPYWRFQGKYYIWGVFREKQHQALGSQSRSREPRYNPIMRKDHVDDTNSGAGNIPVTTKSVGARSPLSPLSYCNSYGSHTS